MTEVAYESLREEILEAVRELADREHQRRVWPDLSYFSNFDEVIHWLYDDTDVLGDAAGSVGYYLRDADEVRALHPLREALDTLLDTLGGDRTDEEYIASPLWGPVTTAARDALAVLEAGRTQVEFPARRSQVVHEVCALSDRAHQRDVWPVARYPDDLARVVRVLLDDPGVLSDPDGSVGRYLRHPGEARAMHRLRDALQAVLDEVGPAGEHPTEAYTSSPRWDDVVDAATTAHDALQGPG